jgi:hypothetical protein
VRGDEVMGWWLDRLRLVGTAELVWLCRHTTFLLVSLTNLTNLHKITILKSRWWMAVLKTKPRARRATKGAAALSIASIGSAKSKPVQISVRRETLEAIRKKKSPIKALIEGFGTALEESVRSGRAVRLLVEVPPAGDPKITSTDDRDPKADNGDIEAALDAARARGRSRVAEILSGDDMLSADEFAELIGTSRVTVNAKRQKRQILALEGAKRGYRFPAWQVGNDGKPFAALPELFEKLGGSPWAVYRFLVQHHPELDGMAGRDALRRGRTDEVIETAESVTRAFA